MLKQSLLFLALVAPLPIHAQTKGAGTPMTPTGGARSVWEEYSNFVTQAADDVPEAKYAYRPTPDVRTFGQLIAHVAGAQYTFCAVALGEKAPDEGDIEKTKTTKADLVKALRESNTYCKRAYAQTDAVTGGTVDFFGEKRTRLFVLMANIAHDSEHYGNVVTYMRLNGMVPPSSKPQPGG